MNKMKQIFLIGTLAIATLASCSKGEPGDTNAPSNNHEIRLNAGVPQATVAPSSRSPILTNDTFTAAVAGWESSSGSATYTETATWATTANITAKEAMQTIPLDQKQVYNVNSAFKTYMLAWHPAGTLTSGEVAFDNPTGEVDAMLVKGEVVGSSADNSGKTLAFAHMTTQLKFVVKGDNTLATGTKLNSIKIKNVQIANGFSLAATPTVKYAIAADLSVPAIAADLIIPIKTTAAEVTPAVAGNAVMINPPTGNQIKLDIETSNSTYNDVAVTIDNDTNFLPGKAYTITLTFMQTGISLGATVDNWTTGTGSGNVN